MYLLKSHIIFCHFFIRGPLMFTWRAMAFEPVLLLQLRLPLLFGDCREDRPVILGHFLAFLDILHCAYDNVIAAEVSGT